MKTPNQVELLLKLHKLEKNGERTDKTKTMGELERRLDPSIRKRYHKLRKRKKTGVAVLQNGACSECRMIYPETHDMLRYENCIYSCEFCGRIFVVADKAVQPASQEPRLM